MDGSLVASMQAHTNNARLAIFSDSDDRIVTESYGKNNPLFLWDGKTGKRISKLHGLSGMVDQLMFTQNSERVLSTSGSEACIW